MSRPITNTRLFARRGKTRKLPFYLAGSMALAALIDLVSAFASMAAQPEENSSAALTILMAFTRPGLMSVAVVIILLAARFGAEASDERAEREFVNGTPVSLKHSPAAKIAAWITIVGGTLSACLVIWACFVVNQTALSYPGADRPSDLVIHLLTFGLGAVALVLVITPVWFGIMVLKKRNWASYALLIYCALAGITIYAVPVLRNMPLLLPGLIVVALLLLWSRLRGSGRAGSLRHCWRGLVLLIGNVYFLGAFAAIDLFADDDDAAIVLLAYGVIIVPYYVISLLLAMWAVNRDQNDFWAGLNATVIVFAPLVLAVLGLVQSLLAVLQRLPIS